MHSVSFQHRPRANNHQIIPHLNDKKSGEQTKITYLSPAIEGVFQSIKAWDIGAENKKYDFSLSQNFYTEYALRKEIQPQCSFEEGRSVSAKNVVVKENGEIWEGSFDKEGLLHGLDCTITTPDGFKAVGHCNHGKFVAGKITYPNGDVSEGPFKDWDLHGPNGTKIIAGIMYKGYFNHGALESGSITFKDGEIWAGTFKGWFLHGPNCSITKPDGFKAVGNFNHGEIDSGLITYLHGYTSEGTFKNGDLHGPHCTKITAGIVYKGRFDNGVFMPEKTDSPTDSRSL